MSEWADAKDVVERCLIHWLPEMPPCKRRDIAASILGNLAAAGHLEAEAGHES
jgi:hypothetical protein